MGYRLNALYIILKVAGCNYLEHANIFIRGTITSTMYLFASPPVKYTAPSLQQGWVLCISLYFFI
jgi:hypothetical protein